MNIIADDYTVRYVLFPYSISALTVQDENGHYNIYINTALSEQNQLAALAHEVKHLVRNDFSTDKTLEETEPYRQAAPVNTCDIIQIPSKHDAAAKDKPAHVLTTGQLLQFMVSLEGSRKKNNGGAAQSASNKRQISIDIFRESPSRQTG